MGADAVDIGKTIHPHPTLGESIGMAAEVFEGVCTDLPPMRNSPAQPPSVSAQIRRLQSVTILNGSAIVSRDGYALMRGAWIARIEAGCRKGRQTRRQLMKGAFWVWLQ